MAAWTDTKASKNNLRLFKTPDIWQSYPDKVVGDKVEEGSGHSIESHFLNALSSTNLLVLTGAGASFAASNIAPKKNAPSMPDLLASVKEKVGEEGFVKVAALVLPGAAADNVEKLLTHCKLFIALHGASDENGKLIAGFIKDAEAAILQRVDFVDTETALSAHETLLRKIARRGIRKARTKIFTTNYDLCFEEAARRQGFVVVDGFSYTIPQVYDPMHFSLDIVRRGTGKDAPDYFENVFHFYKLHGSMDWRRKKGAVIRTRDAEGDPALIYPRDSKYQETFEPPYLDMMGSFQGALREPDTTLLVTGFGFNDSHIAQPILAALESNMSFRLIVCNPSFIPEEDLEDAVTLLKIAKNSDNEFLKKFISLCQLGDTRVILLNGRFQDVVDAVPDLIAETERERHAIRIRTIRDGSPPKGDARPA